jgi:phage terminase Nu1 subunit (DNA packaging protein)
MGLTGTVIAMGKLVNQTELAEIIGVTDVTLWEWQKAGMPIVKQGDRGQANEYDTVAVIAWKEERALAKIRTEAPRDALYRAQERLTQIQIKEKERSLVPVAEIEPEYARLVAAARQRLLQLPLRFTHLPDVHAFVETAVDEALAELARYEPSTGDDAADRAAVGAAGAPQCGPVGG